MRVYLAVTCVSLVLCGARPALRASADVPEITASVVKLDLRQGRPIVDGVYVNGQGPYRFLMDTGTTFNHIDPVLAQSIGIMARFSAEVGSSAGSAMLPMAEGIGVALGPARAERQPFVFASLERFRPLAADVRGVLGQAFLSRFDYLLDLKAERAVFGAPTPNTASTRLPFTIVDGRPVVVTSLGALALDSGCDWVVLYGVSAPKLTHTLTTMAGTIDVGLVKRTLSIGERKIWTGQVVAVPAPPQSPTAGLLPIRLFKTIYVSNSQGFVILN